MQYLILGLTFDRAKALFLVVTTLNKDTVMSTNLRRPVTEMQLSG